MICSSEYRLFFISAPSLRLRENSRFKWWIFPGAGHDQLGQEGRNQLIDELVPTTADTMIETLFGHAPKDTKDWIGKDFYSKLNDAQMDYGRCKELFLKQEDDTRTLQKLASGAKSKSMVGQLTDNLSQIIEGAINTNALFTMMIWEIVTQSLKKKELQDLVSKFSKEIK